MNARGDPYAGLLLEMRRQGKAVQPPGWCLGKVLDVGPDKLLIQADGHVLDSEDLWVAPQLLAGYEEDVQVRLTLTDPKEGRAVLSIGGALVSTYFEVAGAKVQAIPLYDLPGSLTGTIEGTIELTGDRLKKGDWVVLLPDANGEFYYVMTKVVKPGDIVSTD